MADDNSGVKRSRKSNFTFEEIRSLLKFVGKNHEILFSKPQSSFWVSKRQSAWNEVRKAVNAVGIEHRTLDEIKNKWKKYKKTLSEQEFIEFCNQYATPRALQNSPPKVQPPQVPDALLHSESLSPTKLKVTRQASFSQQKEPESVQPPPSEEVCLRWNSHHSNMQTTFPQLLEQEQYVDVTLVAEGKLLKCHRMILSSCSPYFEDILRTISPTQHPVIFLKDIPFWILKSLTYFMYAGEVTLDQNNLQDLLNVAEILKVKGLAGKNSAPPKEDPPAPKPPKLIKSPTKIAPVPAADPLRLAPTVDPLDLLEPKVVQEDSEDKAKDRPCLKKILPKKFRKRKSSEHERSPPPIHLRKGTRSRPNVKVPKYYHDYEEIIKTADIDPLFIAEDIKSEPGDADDDVDITYNEMDDQYSNPDIFDDPTNSENSSFFNASADGPIEITRAVVDADPENKKAAPDERKTKCESNRNDEKGKLDLIQKRSVSK